MSDFVQQGQVARFQLDRRPGRSRLKMKCPSCGKERCLTPYIDVKTGEPVGDQFGRCDHERTCGYDNRPTGRDVGDKELWVSNNDCHKAFRIPNKPDVANFIPYEEFAKTINPKGDNNTLFQFLSFLWGNDRVSDIFRRYNIGSMDLWGWRGCSIFWQMDKDFICRTGKIMEFYIKTDEKQRWIDVKRVKGDDYSHVTFYHSLKGRDFIFKQCLFGEHLLNFYPEDKVVNIVEAEKTAIICAINKPNELFLATGGLQNFRPEVMSVLRGRKINAFPDKGDANRIWKEKIYKSLPGLKITVSDYLQGLDDLNDGDDIADLIIKNKVKALYDGTK